MRAALILAGFCVALAVAQRGSKLDECNVFHRNLLFLGRRCSSYQTYLCADGNPPKLNRGYYCPDGSDPECYPKRGGRICQSGCDSNCLDRICPRDSNLRGYGGRCVIACNRWGRKKRATL